MKLKLKYLEPLAKIPIAYVYNSRAERGFEVTQDIEVELSDGYKLLIPKGFKTDLRSTPSILWGFVKPYNDSLLAYLIHDRLYADKLGQMAFFMTPEGKISPYKARLFADAEMLRWAIHLAPHRVFEAFISYAMVRAFGKRVYDGRASVPK